VYWIADSARRFILDQKILPSTFPRSIRHIRETLKIKCVHFIDILVPSYEHVSSLPRKPHSPIFDLVHIKLRRPNKMLIPIGIRHYTALRKLIASTIAIIRDMQRRCGAIDIDRVGDTTNRSAAWSIWNGAQLAGRISVTNRHTVGCSSRWPLWFGPEGKGFVTCWVRGAETEVLYVEWLVGGVGCGSTGYYLGEQQRGTDEGCGRKVDHLIVFREWVGE